MTSEAMLAYGWIYSTLNADPTIQSLATGGIWRGEAPDNTAMPYIIVLHNTGQSRDGTVFGGGRAFTDMTFQVFGVGPAKLTNTVSSIASRIDTLITTAQPVNVANGTIIASFRAMPLEADPLINGEVQTNIGGEYRIFAKSTS